MGILTDLYKKLNISFKLPKIPNFREIFISNSIATIYLNNNLVKLEKKLKKGKKFYKKIKFIENYNYSLLHQSINDNKTEIIDLIFKQNYATDIDIIEDTDNDLAVTPIHLASLIDNVALIHKLIENGCNPLITTKDGQSLIHFIAHNGNVKSLDYIFQYYQNDINISTNEGWTALHYACFKNRMDVCSYLIDNKADLYFKNKQGLVPIELAILNDNLELFEAMLYYCKNVDTIVHIAASSKVGTRCLSYLLDDPNNINTICDKTKATPLHFACMQNNLKAVKLLCMRGANVNKPDYLGNIPMMYATENGNLEILKILHEYGSDALRKNEEGLNCLSIAMNQEQENNDVKLFYLGLEKYRNINDNYL